MTYKLFVLKFLVQAWVSLTFVLETPSVGCPSGSLCDPTLVWRPSYDRLLVLKVFLTWCLGGGFRLEHDDNSGTCKACANERDFTLRGWAWWIDGLTLEVKFVVCNCELHVPHRLKKLRFDISERTNKLIALRFCIKVWRLTHLYGWSA